MLSFPCIYGSDLWYRKFRRKDWNLEEIKSRKRREFSNIKFNKGTLTTLNWILRFFRIEHPRGYKIFLSNIFQQYIDIANININIGFFKNCNININIELLLAIYCQYIDREIYCQLRAIICRIKAVYCWLFGRLENFLNDFSRFFICRFRFTENVKSESLFV